MPYIERHKYLLLAFFALILVAGISGYQAFKIQDTHNTRGASLFGDNIQVDPEQEIFIPLADEIKIDDETTKQKETQNAPSPLQGEGQDEVNSKQINTENTKNLEEKTTSTESKIENPIILTVAGEKYTREMREETTVYELMQNLSASSVKPFMFSGQDYGAGMGYFVTEINGIKNDPQAGKYWIYYINGDSAKIGISNYIIKKGDIIEWKYEKSF
ncbi:MAG: DUF4430 domain-containing protein [Candidatus Magasanikbacteria bacterium]|jgi:hypothetical protein|nr:DUF4430 domain-containing protein [Candidatus Magasanikbacteria bacterium]MBT4314716.1 DUF4430 domain-containing protein [Candidatus Magasanikbacteria bacterium]MBT4547493.1 DUF4430 domain-containing protein [Candidatus Magasanikbacteria bacterium]MBT6819249.1 DUF4430 domain-containing protein [Candidatus Magasanikbacteria bacterium]